MLDAKFIRDNQELVRKALRDRNSDIDITPVIELDSERRNLLSAVEDLKRQRNEASKAIGDKKRNKEDASAEMSEMKKVSDEINALDVAVRAKEEELLGLLLVIPNVPHSSVPVMLSLLTMKGGRISL